MNIRTQTNPLEKLPVDKKVTVIAIIIPRIPKKLPCLDVSGDDKPLKAKINKIPEIRQNIANKFAEIIFYLSFFLNFLTLINVLSFGTIDLTNLSASNLTSGTIPDARFPATLPAISGANLTNVSSPEVYGFNKNAAGNLIVTTTNGGVDNISGTDYDNFEDVIFAATGFTFSINTDGKLIATI